ncbi:Crp/Fnr family transcriptional regulator [Thalassomonas viridans]|uniref:Crp/Fnr family transcriptional regulator n=1 Tax=Thalassomonas viridans TaxID=137584 RepID=A0AAE9Z3I1_9GAMM|nr:Crp/Fnr family transcriptional regulator [Thalassomonas viridans]WDE04568.1 Crp/Fnr family transcriptional regulator [Thalassomonas viridans]
MKLSFIDFLQQQGFSPEQASELNRQSEPIALAPRTIFMRQGDKVEYLYFVSEGLCQASYHTPEGKKFSKEFYWSGDCIVNFQSLLKQQHSPYALETLSASSLVRLPVAQVQLWRQQNHPCYQHLLETQLLYKENKERFMLLHTPQERYQLFSQQFPELTQQLTDYQLAAYIGITPISLSRIKKRLEVNKG